MVEPADMSNWCGRIDSEDGPTALRWHQRVQPWTAGAARGVTVLGFPCDVGVIRNQGRPGAAEGPAALRRMLGNQAWHRLGPVWDAGDVSCERDGLEEAHGEVSGLVQQLLEEGQLPVVLGGGHDVAFATFEGLARHLARLPRAPVVGAINIDAHLDLRGGRSSSGTPFREITEACAGRGWRLRYLCLGVDEDANTDAFFEAAARVGAEWVADVDLQGGELRSPRAQLAELLAAVDVVHLSVDLDALPAADAPGVSAPAPRGVPLLVVEAIVRQVVASGKLAVGDVCELCPRLDPDGRTARLAARIVTRMTEDRPGSGTR